MKTTDSVKAVMKAITILSVIVLFFSTTVFKLSEPGKYVSENQIALKDSEITINPISVASANVETLVSENKTEMIENVKVAEAQSEKDQKREALEAKRNEVVFEGMTLNELSEKLDRSLNSTLAGQGFAFASSAIDLGVDPYLAVAIVLHETGCKWQCSGAVNNYNNVGGMMGSGGLLQFNSLEEGIDAYMNNLYNNYVSQGLTTADAMGPKYAASTTWSSKVNAYINSIKAA